MPLSTVGFGAWNTTDTIPSHNTLKELGPENVAIASLLLVVNGLVSLYFGLGLEISILVSAFRCVVQLTILGYVLKPVFDNDHPIFVLSLSVLLVLIAVVEIVWGRTPYRHQFMFVSVFLSILASTFTTGFIGNAYAIRAEPWFAAQQFIPTLGMVLGNSMSSVAVGLSSVMTQLIDQKDRIEIYLSFGASRWEAARPVCVEAIKLALLPALNSMSIMGLVSIPGMMTGQILGGSSVQNAVYYQQVITFMISASCCVATVTSVIASVFVVFDDKARLRIDRVVKNQRKKIHYGKLISSYISRSTLWISGRPTVPQQPAPEREPLLAARLEPASAGALRLCHICGITYPKASLPAHQKSCIRRSFGVSQLARSMVTLSTEDGPFYPCTNCMSQIPQYKLASHLRTCKGVSSSRPSATDLFNTTLYNGISTGGNKHPPPASAPVMRSSKRLDKSFGDDSGSRATEGRTDMELARFNHREEEIHQQNRSRHSALNHQQGEMVHHGHSSPYGPTISKAKSAGHLHPQSIRARDSPDSHYHTAMDNGDVVVDPYRPAIQPHMQHSCFMPALRSNHSEASITMSDSTYRSGSHSGNMRVVPKRNLREIPVTSTLSLIQGDRSTTDTALHNIPAQTEGYGGSGGSLPSHQNLMQTRSNRLVTSPRTNSQNYSTDSDGMYNGHHSSLSISQNDQIDHPQLVMGSKGSGEFVNGEVIEEYNTTPRELEKHIAACSKAHKTRKVFDMTGARVKGTDLEKYSVKQRGQKVIESSEKKLAKKSNWRIKHKAFVQMVRSAREPPGSNNSADGGANQEKLDPNPHYVGCPSCHRRFNEDSAARHIPLCKEKEALMNRKTQSQAAGGRNAASGGPAGVSREDMLKRRTAYKPPTPKAPKSISKK
ncbi:hypothetical protein BASA50_001068 [Batrachochytrium salamandrivorans]|uniref:C2HC/C3H-type domain-containing protein n=1 Tax=Batrachochytrium salamandrivorans TaxID=1357716 RepID=A0ABQ8ESF5_9FUNG|nr:hypothetical protein BASA50_001068 [Batrachochytrium salamandrivorans]